MDNNNAKLLAGLIPEMELAREEGTTMRTWLNRRKAGLVPPWCRIGRRIFYFADQLGPWREAQMHGRISKRKACR